MATKQSPSDSFRDQLATIDRRGRRLWVYPNKPHGILYRWRTIVSWALLAILFGTPFVRIDGNPLLLLDIINRRFFIFGHIFWPQDFFLFVLGGIWLVLLIILFTAAFGRLFCGWLCPQTIFLEMVFRKIEYLIEGNGPRQRELDRRPMDADKFIRKSVKHVLFFGLAFLIGNLLLSYFVGTERLWQIITDPPAEHVTGLVAMVIFSGIFYFIFSWFREQACTLVCPYGRLQSVLLDNNSIVIAYDFKRGEPRGPMERGALHPDRGHCIDCAACVKVCPTGIDIRNGTQLECVNCSACIDACDRVMDRIKLPRGLIRYTSWDRIANGRPYRFTLRMVLYSIALTLLTGLILFFLLSRSDVETTILRASGSLYEEVDDNIRNIYTITVINKTSESLPIDVRLKDSPGKIAVVGPALDLPPQGEDRSVLSVEIPRKNLYTSNSMLTIEILSGGEVLQEVRTTFVGPDPRAAQHHDADDEKEETHGD